MTQETGELDGLVRKRIRALRVAQGWSLEELATRARVSQSTLSRIETYQAAEFPTMADRRSARSRTPLRSGRSRTRSWVTT